MQSKTLDSRPKGMVLVRLHKHDAFSQRSRFVGKTKIIKRYQNRKLYDTESSRYVTLDDIALMIKNGEDVKVVDNKTKDDLTGVTLTQIIYEEEKKRHSILPLDTLKKLIRTGGESISDLYDKLVQPGVNSILSAREDFETSIGKLIKRGRIKPEEGKSLIAEIKSGTGQIQRRFDNSFQQVLDVVKGMALLARQVEELEQQVESLENEVRNFKTKGTSKK